MNQIITIKEIKGFSSVRAKVGSGGGTGGLPGGHSSGAGPARLSAARRLQSPGPSEARRTRVFVSPVPAEASPTPERCSPCDPITCWSPRLCLLGATTRGAGQPPPALVGAAPDTPAPAPYPLRGRGQRQPRHVAASSTESAGRAGENPGGNRESSREQSGVPPPRRPRPGRSPHARRRPRSRSVPAPAPHGSRPPHAAARKVGAGPGREGGAGSPVRAPRVRGGRGRAPQLLVFGGTPTSRPREEGRP